MSDNLSAWERYKRNLGETRPWDIVNPNVTWVDDETHDKRYQTCLNCPELIKLTKQCKKCGCFMYVKSRLEKAECPLGKW